MILPAGGASTAIGVKSHVLYSRMLTDDDYFVILNSNSIAEITDILKQTTAYRSYLETLPPAQIHRIDLENAIRSAILNEAESFLSYLSGPRKDLFQDWLSWYEAENLKSVLRWIRSRRLERDEMSKRLFHVPGSKISYDHLLNSRDYAEALEALRETNYYSYIQAPIKRLQDGEGSLFSLELAIDNMVEARLYKNLYKLSPSEFDLLKSLFGTRIDLLNLYNFHRCTWYYNMTLEETLSRMLPVKYKIKTQHLREMSRGTNSWEDRLARLEQNFPDYVKIFKEALEQPDSELALEMSIKRFLYIKAQQIFRTGAPGFHTAMSYFFLKSYEVGDIIHIIEDVRYNYDRRNAARYLIRPINTGGEPRWQ